MTTAANQTEFYTVTKSRLYLEGERYSSGEGFQGGTPDPEQADLWFAVFSQPDTDGRTHAVELRQGCTVIKHVGPSMRDAERSMLRAYHAKRAA